MEIEIVGNVVDKGLYQTFPGLHQLIRAAMFMCGMPRQCLSEAAE